VTAFLLDLKRRTGRVWANADQTELLRTLRVTRADSLVERPTVAGLICLGEFPQQFLYQARIQFTMYAGPNVTDRDIAGARYLDAREFDGPAQEMIDSAVTTILQALRSPLHVDGTQHTRTEELPREALREALVNAIAHRDYGPYQIGNVIQVFLFSDRLEIRSPGGLHGGARISNLAESQSTRNPLLMRLLMDIGLVENRGSGVSEMIALCRKAGLAEPTFRTTGTNLTVTFWRTAEPTATRRAVHEPDPVYVVHPQSAEDRILAFFTSNPELTNEDVRDALGLDRWQATRLLQRMVKRGLLIRHGERRGVYYTRA
jgi:ATP-dependent DNA helicase RecG